MSGLLRGRMQRFGLIIALAAFTVWTLGPVAWAVVSSLLPTAALTQSPPDLSPSGFTLSNYVGALSSGPNLGASMVNSLIVSVLTSALGVLVGAPAAYALANLGVRGSRPLLVLVLASQMFPAVVVAIPMFVVLAAMGLVGTYTALVIVDLSFVIPIVVWVLKGFFQAIPPALEKSAAIDGASVLNTFRLIVLPISAPPLFAVAVFAFIESWNEFFFAVILTSSSTKTVPIAVSQFSGQYQTLYGQMVAAAILASLPVVCLAVVFQKQIIKGFVEGSVKG